MKTNVIVLRTAGVNCDYETVEAFRMVGAVAERVHVNELRAHPNRLRDFQVLVIPGGFSYGDDLGAGKILANELVTFLREPIQRFVDEGKLILGVCNGFQVLVRTGLLPAFQPMTQEVTLTINEHGRFEDRWVYLKPTRSRCVFTQGCEESALWYLPIAHAEGRFVPANQPVLDRLVRDGLVVFQYVNPKGAFDGFPWNPNGSVSHIAGVCDTTGRVMGMMPHPERHVVGTQHPQWTRIGIKPEGDGLQLFRNAVSYVETNL